MIIDIIGAGIGGLTTAVALEKIGYQPTIYEQANALKPVGAGIILAGNAMRVYKKLGLDQILQSEGIPLNGMNVVTTDMKTISKIELSYFKKKYDLQSLAIHRGRLQQVLLDHLKSTKILLDYKLESLTKLEDGYRLNFDNGQSTNSSLLIGADGINSQVRVSLFPNANIRTTQQICWRGVADFDLPPTYQNEVYEIWGKGDRFGFVRIAPQSVYWFAVKSFKHNSYEFSNAPLAKYYTNYPSFVQQLIAETPTTQIYETVIEDLKPMEQWYDEFVCLLGDAAHATTPNMGQGACQSIEDAYAISKALENHDTPEAFEKFQQLRMEKAYKVVKGSRLIGNIAHWTNPVATFLRNGIMRLSPQTVNRKQLEELFQ